MKIHHAYLISWGAVQILLPQLDYMRACITSPNGGSSTYISRLFETVCPHFTQNKTADFFQFSQTK